jgi:NTE family protein
MAKPRAVFRYNRSLEPLRQSYKPGTERILKAKPVVGLALGGGAARGLAHIGVLEVLQNAHVPIDIICGTSMGAIIGALYAKHIDAELIRTAAMKLNRSRVTSLFDFTIPNNGFLKGKRIINLLHALMGGHVQFDDLKLPFSCVATDIYTGEEIVMEDGDVPEAIRASISIPLIFTVSPWEGRSLVDGGLVNPVPVSVLKQKRADFIIAVNVIPDLERGGLWLSKHPKLNLMAVGMQSFHIATYALVLQSIQKADVVISPDVAHIPPSEFFHIEECISQGAKAATAMLPVIKEKLDAFK